ncbi:DNA-binding transcriptional regulator, MurR/RpiR family, contains HTH and SIS domains [Facklamia miroungae]|uniref:DNA-binding transcriptional regulator, MurR/RpiR family, contains HTH and SIS domains n=1 Tax=Facklamia miroungae TaxID=120956 RepID=A0A1G7QQ41_9LACT|nr:DNA-binding transcriptional regulator, MurR/RpiR family, contains HTH and SIS domains [Facklamia miroungae]
MDSLTSSERKVANYIIDHPQEIVTMSAQDLGKICGSSSSAVIRLVKALDFSGFTEFKVQLSGQIGHLGQQPLTDISEFETVSEIKDKLAMNLNHFLSTNNAKISEELIQKVVEELNQAKIIFVYGIGASHIVAKDIQQKFTRLGKQVICSLDHHELVAAISLQGKEALFVGISASGETSEVIYLLELAKTCGLRTLALTEDTENRLCEKADIALKTAKTDLVILRSGATLSIINHLYVIGIIYYSYLTLNYDENIEILMKTRQATDSLRDFY